MKEAICLFGLVLAALQFVNCRAPKPSAEDIRKQIEAQLPMNSTKTQVIAFLDARNISHSDIHDFFELDQEHNRINTRIITASIRRDQAKSGIYMVFYFDNGDRLTKYEVKDFATGV